MNKLGHLFCFPSEQVNAVERRVFRSFGSRRAADAGRVNKCDLSVKVWDLLLMVFQHFDNSQDPSEEVPELQR